MKRPNWMAALALALGALVPLGRVLADPAGSVPGIAFSDIDKHLWSYWHSAATLGELGWTPYLNAPGGGLLLDLMALPSLLMLPVSATLGPVVACNAWVWLSLLATGLATWGLARELGATGPGALLAGLSTQSAPFLLGYPLHSGVHERLAVWVFPLVLLALLKRRWGWTALAVAGSLVAVAGCQVYGLVLALLLLPVGLWLLRDPQGRAPRVGALVGIAAVLALLFFVVRHAAVDPWSLAAQPGRVELRVGLAQGAVDPTTLGMLLDPLTARAEQLSGAGDLLVETTYLGWGVLLGALYGAWRAPRSRGVVALALVLASLALGPVNPLYRLVCLVLPSYGANPAIWQQVAVFSPLAAVGLAHAAPRWPAALVLGGLILVERLLALPVPVVAEALPVAVSEVYAAVEPDGGLVELPRAWRGGPVPDSAAFRAQMQHGRPLPFAINPRSTLLDAYAPVVHGEAVDWGVVRSCLRRGGFRWVVLHRDGFEDGAGPVDSLRSQWGEPVADDGTAALFDLGPAGEPASKPPPSVSHGRWGRQARCPF